MASNKLKNIIEGYKLRQLQDVAEKINLNGYSKLNKAELINALLLPENELKTKEVLGLNKVKRVIKDPIFAIIFSFCLFLAGWYVTDSYSKKSVSKSDIDKIESHIKSDSEYSEEMRRYESLKKSFCNKVFPYGYRIFGARNGEIVSLEEIENGDYLNRAKYRYQPSQILFNPILKTIKVDIFWKYLDIPFNKNTQLIMYNGNVINNIPLEENNLYKISPFNFDSICPMFVLFEQDINNPIFAMGMGDCKNSDN